MTDRTQETPPKPKMIGATLFLEHLADIDYRLLTERVGGALGIDPKAAETCDPKGAIVIPAAGDVIMGVRIDAPYPAPLDGPAGFAYWWPDAKKDIARNKAHLMVYCGWSGFSRYDAHMRHLVLVRELVEQLPDKKWGRSRFNSLSSPGPIASLEHRDLPFFPQGALCPVHVMSARWHACVFLGCHLPRWRSRCIRVPVNAVCCSLHFIPGEIPRVPAGPRPIANCSAMRRA
jgi:hypothetical protein